MVCVVESVQRVCKMCVEGAYRWQETRGVLCVWLCLCLDMHGGCALYNHGCDDHLALAVMTTVRVGGPEVNRRCATLSGTLSSCRVAVGNVCVIDVQVDGMFSGNFVGTPPYAPMQSSRWLRASQIQTPSLLSCVIFRGRVYEPWHVRGV